MQKPTTQIWREREKSFNLMFWIDTIKNKKYWLASKQFKLEERLETYLIRASVKLKNEDQNEDKKIFTFLPEEIGNGITSGI